MDKKLDETTGDIEVVNNDVSLTSGLAAKRQHLEQRLRTFLGEWFLDTSRGVPYFQDILVKNPNFNAVSAAFKNTILGTAGALEILEFELDFDDTVERQLNFDTKVRFEEGDVDFSALIEV
jgi:hypothetical protein